MDIRVGDQLFDNDPRNTMHGGAPRVLTITDVGYSDGYGRPQVRAQQSPQHNHVRIRLDRIHDDGKARRSGFNLLTVGRPASAPGSVRLRSFLVILPDGTWNMCGWSGAKDGEVEQATWDGIEDDDIVGARQYWVEVTVAVPVEHAAETVEGRATPVDGGQ